MEEETLVATPPLEGDIEKTSISQEPVPVEQSTEPVQESGERKVERLEQPTSSQEGVRPKPSNYFKQRQENQNLKRNMLEMERRLKGLETKNSTPSVEPEKPKRNYEKEIWDKPIDIINELIENALATRGPEIFNQSLSQKQSEFNRQEALDLIFKNETVKTDGDEGYSRIIQIIEDHGLDIVAKKDPLRAAKSAIKFYELEFKKAQPSQAPKKVNPDVVPKKGQMVSTQTGAPGISKEVSMDDLLNELKDIKTKIGNNPELNFDPKIRERVQEIKKKVSEKYKG